MVHYHFSSLGVSLLQGRREGVAITALWCTAFSRNGARPIDANGNHRHRCPAYFVWFWSFYLLYSLLVILFIISYLVGELQMCFPDVAFPPSWANFYVTYVKYCDGGNGFRTAIFPKACCWVKRRYALWKTPLLQRIFFLCRLNFMTILTVTKLR